MKTKSRAKTDTYHHGNLPQACIAAGVSMLEQGRSEFSLRDIAREVGVSHGAPSRHFGSKEGLLAAIAEEGFRMFNDYLEEVVPEKNPEQSDQQYFHAMGNAYVRFGLEHPQHYRMMFSNAVNDHTEYQGLAEEGCRAFGQLIQMVEYLQKQGTFRQGRAVMQAYQIWSSVHGLVSLFIENRVMVGLRFGLVKPEELEAREETALKLMEEMSEHLFSGFSVR